MAKKKVEAVLAELHEDYALLLTRWLNYKYADDDGNAMPPPAHILREARQFLKDNGIEAAVVPGSPLEGLLTPFEESSMPFTNNGSTH